MHLYQRLLARFLSQPLSETLKDSIYQEMNAFCKDPKSGDLRLLLPFEQQTAMPKHSKVEPGTHLYEASLNGVWGWYNECAVTNDLLMQIILSGGENKEAIDWCKPPLL